jgi:biotin carboxyl carrier protein
VQFDLDIGGRIRRLEVERRDGGFRVAVDDRAFEVDARQAGRETLSLLVREGDGPVRSVDATVSTRAGSGGFEVSLDGHSIPAALVAAVGGRAREGAGGSGPQPITAPMPGRVVRVLVGEGDTVAARQGLVVIEAMKMENELRSSRAGRVTTVRVAEGQSVEAGALLVLVE